VKRVADLADDRPLARLNAAPAAEAERRRRACCGSRRGARAVAAARPSAAAAARPAAPDREGRRRGSDDRLEAFAAHPRIGERAGRQGSGGSASSERSRGWSAGEQSGVQSAEQEVIAALAEGNRAYEERFGHVFLVCATGKSAAEMLEILGRRLGNDPATELGEAAEEQRKITALRLAKLLET
jgi:OHCU decarboxylase